MAHRGEPFLSFAVAFAVAGVAFSAVVPTATIAPGVHLPFLAMGGVNRTLYPFYPDYSNYTLWASLGGTGFDTAWEYRTQAAVSRAMVANNDRGRNWRSQPAALLAQNCGDDAGICHIFPVLVDAGGFHNRNFGATHMRASPYPRPA